MIRMKTSWNEIKIKNEDMTASITKMGKELERKLAKEIQKAIDDEILDKMREHCKDVYIARMNVDGAVHDINANAWPEGQWKAVRNEYGAPVTNCEGDPSKINEIVMSLGMTKKEYAVFTLKWL